jgi:transposase InsO family protein
MRTITPFMHLCRMGTALGIDLVRFLGASFRSRAALAAENLFLRKQLALYRERQVKPRRASDPMRLGLVLLAQCFAWRKAVTIVQPATLLRWHREAFRLLWRWRSRPGRPRLPGELQCLIAAMARDNPSWGEERIAAELLVKLGLRVSPRTVRRYMACGAGGGWRGAGNQRWGTFVRNHAEAIVACDFCVAVTATFRVLYVFVALEVGSRRLVHINVTSHPTAAWTVQQFREVLAAPHAYRFVLHDRDSIYAPWLDAAVTAMGVRVLRTPVQAPQANAFCERLLGSLRRECLDYLIPFGEEHLRQILRVWKMHYNRGRPHASLGPGLPAPPPGLPAAPIGGHHLPREMRITARPILGGLHHEYALRRWPHDLCANYCGGQVCQF